LVQVDEGRLRALGVPVQQIMQSLQSENLNIPAGRITASNFEFGIRAVGQLGKPEELGRILIGHAGGKPVLLKDVARISDSHKEQRTISRFNGQDAVALNIRKNTDANTVLVAKAVKKRLTELRAKIPKEAGLSLAYDQSVFVEQAIENMKATAVEGAFLAVALIFLFLGSIRSTLAISLSIPLSVLGTLLVMYFTGMTLNMMSLAGLLMGIGRIVDDAIVVLENIFRHMERGESPREAAVRAGGEVGMPVLASTLTTISVFLPLFLVGGFLGQAFRPISTTFAVSLLCSYVTAISVIPMLASRFRGDGEERITRGPLGSVLEGFDRLWKRLEAGYRIALAAALAHRARVLALAFALLLVSLAMIPIIGFEFQGRWDRGDFVVNLETGMGSSLAWTDERVKLAEVLIRKEVPEVKWIFADAGRPASGGISAQGGSASQNPRLGGFTIVLKDRTHRKRSVFEVMQGLRETLPAIPGATFRVSELFTMTGQKPVEILIKGDDLQTLSHMAEKAKGKIAGVPGLSNMDLNWRSGAPEYQIVLNREKAAQSGLGFAHVAGALRALLAPEEAGRFRERGKEIEIQVRLPENERSTRADITRISIPSPYGARIPLSELASVELAQGPTQITRQDRSRFVSVQADTTGTRALSEIMKDVRPELDAMEWPDGYAWEVGGEEKQRQESFASLLSVLFLGIVLVYVILAIQFESFLHPFTVIMSIPLELVGVFGGLLITHTHLSIFGMLGVIMLTGIVVSNAILLVNTIILLRERGMSRDEAVMTAGPLRLRPILMTALATVFAMIPLAMGLRPGSELFAVLARGVVGGLLSSTFLTLLVIPVVYVTLDNLTGRSLKQG
ncbi:MAG: efflux RND transporter permease subunit, partial [Armatimonadetes bacterium]|nr:efflux RND transporter permease subunit [Armatimonadota bacterium]